MPIPDRSELPQEFVAFVDRQNAQIEAGFTQQKPVLPADTTPPELIEAAKVLDSLLQRYVAEESLAARFIEREYRPFIADVLAENITEPVDENWRQNAGLSPIRWGDTDLYLKKDLESAWYRFERLLCGVVTPEESYQASVTRGVLRIRQNLARKKYGLDLDLTDDEWMLL